MRFDFILSLPSRVSIFFQLKFEKLKIFHLKLKSETNQSDFLGGGRVDFEIDN